MEILHTSSYYQIICLPGEQIIRIRRMKKPFSSSFDLTAEMTEVNAVLDRVRGPHFGVLLDMRETPGRNDPEFERAIEPFRARLHAGFGRSAVLTQTVAGKLQVNRQAGADRTTRAFTSEQEAELFLRKIG